MQTESKSIKNRDAITIPDLPIMTEKRPLARTIAALVIERAEDCSARLGAVHQLSAGTNVQVCGSGFSDRTVKVRAEDGLFYFVFTEDLNALPV